MLEIFIVQLLWQTVCDIARDLQASADKVRQGKDKDFEKSKGLVALLPPFLLRPVLRFTGLLGFAAGCNIPALGVRAYPFGTALVRTFVRIGLLVCWPNKCYFYTVHRRRVYGRILAEI